MFLYNRNIQDINNKGTNKVILSDNLKQENLSWKTAFDSRLRITSIQITATYFSAFRSSLVLFDIAISTSSYQNSYVFIHSHITLHHHSSFQEIRYNQIAMTRIIPPLFPIFKYHHYLTKFQIWHCPTLPFSLSTPSTTSVSVYSIFFLPYIFSSLSDDSASKILSPIAITYTLTFFPVLNLVLSHHMLISSQSSSNNIH